MKNTNSWTKTPLKYVCQLNPSVNFSEFDEESFVSFLPMDKIKGGYFIPNKERLSKQSSSYTSFENGDILLAKVTPCFENGNIAIAENLTNGKGFGSSELFVIRPDAHLNTKFLFYYFQSTHFKQEGEASMTGAGGLKRVSPDLLKSHYIALPSLEAQNTIADYLDSETRYIDELIAEKEQMLFLLEEKKSALIDVCISKGINSDTQFKLSGVDWIKEIPFNWNVTRLKYLTKVPFAYGANEAALEENPNWPRFVRITDIMDNGSLKEETFRSLAPEIAEPYLLEEGDILFARSGATVGKSFLYDSSWGKACFAGYLIRFRCAKNIIFPKFVYYYTMSQLYWQQIESGTIQATIQNFSAEKYSDLLICVPPIEEQKQIVDYLDESCNILNSLISEVAVSIIYLKERRSALITSATTGKILIEDMQQ